MATLAASAGKGGLPGDLNNDGLQDAEQSGVSTFAWITENDFQAGLNGELSDIKKIVAMEIMADPNSQKMSPNYQLESVEVLAEGDINLDGQGNKPTGRVVLSAPWDTLKFAIAPSSSDSDGILDDIDPNRAGVQSRISIDISRSDINVGDFNAYYKYVSSQAISDYGKLNIQLRDLDGDPITAAGWYDFTRSTPYGDGALFISKDGKIVGIDLILTDNAFGDNDVTANRILDPGAPLKIAHPTPEGGQISPENTIVLPKQAEDQSTSFQIGASRTSADPQNPDFILKSPQERGGTTEITLLEQRLRNQARIALIEWSREAGLANLVTVDQKTNATDFASGGGNRDQSASALLYRTISAEGPALLEALALGAAGLYLTQAIGERNLEQMARQWIRRLRPTPKTSKSIGHFSQVLSIFVIQASGRRPKLVAAKLLSDSIDIIAELPLVLPANHGTGWDELDLSHAFAQMRKTLKEQFNDNQLLLLLDPLLQSHLYDVKDIGQAQSILRHTDFDTVLRGLPNDELELLRHWLNRPSQTSLQHSPGCRQVMAKLAGLQGHWVNHMGESMANVAGVLELSIALGNLQPELAMI